MIGSLRRIAWHLASYLHASSASLRTLACEKSLHIIVASLPRSRELVEQADGTCRIRSGQNGHCNREDVLKPVVE